MAEKYSVLPGDIFNGPPDLDPYTRSSFDNQHGRPPGEHGRPPGEKNDDRHDTVGNLVQFDHNSSSSKSKSRSHNQHSMTRSRSNGTSMNARDIYDLSLSDHLNETFILHTLKKRFEEQLIYVSTS